MVTFWRGMGEYKRTQLVAGDQNPDKDKMVGYMRQFLNVESTEDLPAERATFYGINLIKGCKAVSDATIYGRALFLEWPEHDWVSMNVLFFLENPQVERNAKFRDNTNSDVREVLNQAITRWTRWMTVHFDQDYQHRLVNLRHWLKQPPFGPNHKHDGLHLLFMVNNLLSSWCYMLTQGASSTRFAGISFTDSTTPAPGTAFRLLDALEEEFLTSHATDDPYPHRAFREWLKSNTIVGYPVENTLPPPATKSMAPPAEKAYSPPTTSAPPTPPGATAKVCPFHAAFVWNCVSSAGTAKPCRYGTSCAHLHIDPRTISLAEVSAACISLLRPGKFTDSILAAATLHTSKP
jgi:hypothetical protein